MTRPQPSMDHLERHQRDLQEYKHNVHSSAAGRFGPAWWGLWEQFVHVPADGTVVDLGAGSGALLSRLRDRLPHARLVGVELHPEMAALARQTLEGSNVDIVEADLAVPVPLEDACADVVVSALVFHELPHPPDLLVNAARLVKPGGHLVLFDIVKFPLSEYLADRELSRDSLDHYREHCLFSPEDLAFLVDHHGFEVQEVVGRNQGRFAQVFAVRR